MGPEESSGERQGERGARGVRPSGFRFSPRPNRAGEIEWREWGEDAFREAERDGKLVLLSVSAVWCHWCHVMDETTYSDPGVIERINRSFIPVRVDSDKRPDINRRYNQGGWPTTAFLIATGQAVAGLTFAPPDRFAELLDKLSAMYKHRKSDIEVQAAAAVAEERELTRSLEPAVRGIDAEAGDKVLASILSAWDKGYGGLGEEPKFPTVGALELALSLFAESGNAEARSFVVSTLDGMSTGEIFDRVEGGFFRYATARDWSTPHYEKMLGDNAELASIYMAASSVLGREDYAETARGTLDYAIRRLLDEEDRGFYGSQDADETYYHRDADGRALLEAPAVDRTIYTDSTAQMISALVVASAAFDDPGLLQIAQRSTDFIWREGFLHGRGVCHYFELPGAVPGLWGQAPDQALFLRALLDLYQATENPTYLERAVELGEVILERYQLGQGWLGEMDGEQSPAAETMGESIEARAVTGVLSDIPPDVPDIIANGNGARALTALDAMAPGRGFREAAGRILESLSGIYEGHAYFAAAYALGVEMFLKGSIEIRVSPTVEAETRRETLRAAISLFNHRKVVRPETVEDYVPSGEEAAVPPATVCSPGRCLPVNSADELAEAVASLVKAEPGGPESSR